jgi:hypothetical protein
MVLEPACASRRSQRATSFPSAAVPGIRPSRILDTARVRRKRDDAAAAVGCSPADRPRPAWHTFVGGRQAGTGEVFDLRTGRVGRSQKGGTPPAALDSGAGVASAGAPARIRIGGGARAVAAGEHCDEHPRGPTGDHDSTHTVRVALRRPPSPKASTPPCGPSPRAPRAPARPLPRPRSPASSAPPSSPAADPVAAWRQP